MRVGGHPAAVVAHQQEVAKAAQLVARVNHDARASDPDRHPPRYRDIDAVIVQSTGLGPELRQDATIDRPREFGCGAGHARGRGRGACDLCTRRGRPGRRTRGRHPGRADAGQAEALPYGDRVRWLEAVGADQAEHVETVAPRNGVDGVTRRDGVESGPRNAQGTADRQDIRRRQAVGLDQPAYRGVGAPGNTVERIAAGHDDAHLLRCRCRFGRRSQALEHHGSGRATRAAREHRYGDDGRSDREPAAGPASPAPHLRPGERSERAAVPRTHSRHRGA